MSSKANKRKEESVMSLQPSKALGTFGELMFGVLYNGLSLGLGYWCQMSWCPCSS